MGKQAPTKVLDDSDDQNCRRLNWGRVDAIMTRGHVGRYQGGKNQKVSKCNGMGSEYVEARYVRTSGEIDIHLLQ